MKVIQYLVCSKSGKVPPAPELALKLQTVSSSQRRQGQQLPHPPNISSPLTESVVEVGRYLCSISFSPAVWLLFVFIKKLLTLWIHSQHYDLKDDLRHVPTHCLFSNLPRWFPETNVELVSNLLCDLVWLMRTKEKNCYLDLQIFWLQDPRQNNSPHFNLIKDVLNQRSQLEKVKPKKFFNFEMLAKTPW